jgi:cytochrome c biogenesis protein
MASAQTKTSPRRSLASVWLEFLGSMNLAITLLVAIAVAAIIGTVLKQNQPYNDYVFKFGPFWFEFFKTLHLYDVYHALWFLFMLAFLVVSTSTCIYRNAPTMLREIRHWRENVTEKSLRAFKHAGNWNTSAAPDTTRDQAQEYLRRRGYQTRVNATADHTVIAAKRGGGTRLGYIATHVAIVVICIGGLLDGNIPIMIGEALGRVVVETRDIPVREVPKASFLPANNLSFRGNVTIPEGQAANFTFLTVRDGYLVQRLPFTVEVKKFRIEHYDTGQPKNFESDLVIHDKDLKKPLEQTISVNHPLTYKGVTIYQASFGDGGSKLRIKALPLANPTAKPVELQGAVNGKSPLQTSAGPMTVEFADFRLFNIHNISKDPDKEKFKNVGPSFRYKLRSPDGKALEYNNYMYPVEIDGRWFFLSGVRNSPAEEFRYLHIPAGPDHTLKRFTALLAMLHNETALRRAAAQIADVTLSVKKNAGPKLRARVIDKTIQITKLFRDGGLQAVEQAAVDTFPKEKRKEGFRAYMNILRIELGALYEDVLAKEGIDPKKPLTPALEQYFEDAVTAMSGLPNYGSPVFLKLESFQQIRATGLEMTRSPGKYVVYLGCGLLILGVFMLFFLHHRRLWVYLKKSPEGTEVLFAGSDNRNSPDFAREFEAMYKDLENRLKA